MGKLITSVFLLLLSFSGIAQLTISDDFSDGDFTTNPAWTGDDSLFEVSSSELHLNDHKAGAAYLSIPSSISQKASWEFYLRLDFNPSSSNYAKIYLISDQQNLNGALNGYFIRVGYTNDRISLFRQSGTNASLVAESADDWVNSSVVEARIKVTRDSSGFWVLKADTAGGTNFQPLDSAADNTYPSGNFFGVSCVYTISRADKFYFDDFLLSGESYVDQMPPQLQSVSVTGNHALSLVFNEKLDTGAALDPGNYIVDNGIGKPDSVVFQALVSSRVTLYFSNAFANRTVYHLFTYGIEDMSGNAGADTVRFTYYQPEKGDIVINELMADPLPVVGIPPNALPEREYIELYNRTQIPINFGGWILNVGGTSRKLPSYVLEPDSFVVITKDEGVAEFDPTLPVLGIDISSVALTNSGTTLSLFTPTGLVMTTVSYTDGWYNDPNKTDGGWSLEQIDPDNLCGGSQNWKASTNAIGGTPGRRNSVFGVNPDTTRPAFDRIAILNDSSILVRFTEAINPYDLTDTANYVIDPYLGIKKLEVMQPDQAAVKINFQGAIDPGQIYTLSLKKFPSDCSGNEMAPDSVLFAVPAIPQPGELLINEVLFNPFSGGADFVEIYNHSDQIFDLSKLRLGNWNTTMQTAENLADLTDESYLLQPGRYLVLTTDPSYLSQSYIIKKPENLWEVNSLPAMPDNSGSIALVTSSLQTLDYFEYSDGMHLPLLKNKEGISLERVSFDKSTHDQDNWASAAASAGYATPGYRNSHFLIAQPSANVSLEPRVFSPNQDGYHDLLSITYNFSNPNNVVSLSVWSAAGYKLAELQHEVSVGAQGFFTWNGTDERGQLQPSGIYIIVMDYFNASGTHQVIRKTCVLSL